MCEISRTRRLPYINALVKQLIMRPHYIRHRRLSRSGFRQISFLMIKFGAGLGFVDREFWRIPLPRSF